MPSRWRAINPAARGLRLIAKDAAKPNKCLIEERAGAAPLIQGLQTPTIFSISHSSTMVGLAMLPYQLAKPALLGLDVERLNPRRQLQTVRYFCNAEQLKQFDALPDEYTKRQFLTRLWTQKEAFCKAHGNSVFDANLKTLAVELAATKAGNLYSSEHQSALAHFYLSIYCDVSFNVFTEHFTLDACGEVVQIDNPALEWQVFCATAE